MKKTYPNLTIISPSNALLNAFKKHLFFVFAFVALFGFSTAFGQALLPVYNSDPAIPQAGWTYGASINTLTDNYDCTGENVIRFNDTNNEFAIVNYSTAATNVSFMIQRNNNQNKSLLIEQSVDGINYTLVSTVTNTQVAVNGTTYTLNYSLNTASRYVRFNMTQRDGGAYFLDAISVYNTTAPACSCYSIPSSNDNNGITSTTVGSATFNVPDVTYYNYTGSIPNLIAGSNVTSSITFDTGYTYDSHIWIDFNDDGVFDNTTEKVYTGVSLATNPTTLNTTFTLPGGATPGQHKMRIGTADSGQATPTPCYSGSWGVTIDLFVNIIAPAACTTPTVQPTALGLTPALTTITGSFTAASPAPNSYLVVVSTSATPPSPANGTTYTIGGTVGTGYTVVDTDSNTTFTATGLLSSTLYYVYVFSYNNLCSGGPRYLTTSPLTGSTTTLAASYCAPTSWDPDGLYINSLGFIGTLADPVANTSTFSATGYQNFTGLSPIAIQAQGEGVNIVASSTGNEHVRGAWKAWVDWNRDGVFNNTNELVYDIYGFVGSSVTFGFVIPAAATVGNYRMRIRVNNSWYYSWFGTYEDYGFDFNACDNFIDDYWANDTEYFGETEDYLFTVVASCPAVIVSKTDGERCSSGTVDIEATGASGVTGFNIYANETGGSPLSPAPTFSLVGGVPTATWTSPSLTTTTTYWIVATNGSCESLVRTAVIAKVSPTPVVTFTPSAPIVCGDNNPVQITAGGDKEIVYLLNEKFSAGTLGAFSNINSDTNSATVKTQTAWKNQTSTYLPFTNPDTNVWFPAVSSGFGANKFAITTSDALAGPTVPVQNSLTLTSAINSTDFLNLTLNLKFYYSRYYPGGLYPADEYAVIELSTNGGTTYPIILETFTSNTGIGTRFVDLSYDLSAYINQTNLKIRVRNYSDAGSGWLPDGIAVDDVEIFGEKSLNTSFNYDTSVVNAYTNPLCTPIYLYTPGTPAATIWIKPTPLQLENPSFSIPVTTILSNGCTASETLVITNNTRTWAGVTADWNTPTNWKPNVVPTIDNCVIIPTNTVISGTNYNAYGKNLIVKSTGSLNIQPSNNLTIADGIIIEPSGTFQIENNASLIQISNVANTGNITYRRNATVKRFDYVYWSSPVIDFNMNGIPSAARYSWAPTATNANGGQGNWASTSGTMESGKGYIFRVLNSTPLTSTPDNLTATFTGVPFNGIKNITVNRGTDSTGPGTLGTPRTISDDNWNLIGNPYPSAIGVNEFLQANSALEGFVYIWTHGNSPYSGSYQNPFYQNYTYNYDPNDYIQINKTGATSGSGDYKIAAGQGFFALMVPGAVPGPASATVTFNNSMRSENFSNNMFYKTANTSNNLTLDNSRIWLDLNSTAGTSRILVGYVEDATNQKDRMFDAFTENKDEQNFYSTIDNVDNEMFKIQGKALPFNDNDIVPLGIKIIASGTHSIAISEVDGLFLGTQDIYLKDELLNIYHDLKTTPYSFTATAGIHDDRFKLVYKNTVLSNQTFNENEIKIAKNNNIIEIVSGNEIMDNVKVYDVRGRLIIEKSKINNNSISIDMVGIQDQVLIVNIVTAEGIKVTRKIL